jgi:uncharacterized protein (TIGR03435 family)
LVLLRSEGIHHKSRHKFAGVDRRVLDRTGLTGTLDFSVEWTLAPDPAQPPGAKPDATGPTFLETLQEQIGLKLQSTTGPVDVLVIHHVERPTAD